MNNELYREKVRLENERNDRFNQARYTDIPKYLRNNIHKSNSDFARGLGIYLRDKFHWRDWLVVSYNPVAGWDKHTVGGVDTWHWFRTHGRNLVVASVPENQSYSPGIDKSQWCQGSGRDYRGRAHHLYSTIYSGRAQIVVERRNDLYFSAGDYDRVSYTRDVRCGTKSWWRKCHFDVVVFF